MYFGIGLLFGALIRSSAVRCAGKDYVTSLSYYVDRVRRPDSWRLEPRMRPDFRIGASMPAGQAGNPNSLTLGTSIATRAGARRRHRPETRREIKLAVRLPESQYRR